VEAVSGSSLSVKFGGDYPKPVCTLDLHPYQIFIISAIGFDQCLKT
jgi:hypothetical protein